MGLSCVRSCGYLRKDWLAVVLVDGNLLRWDHHLRNCGDDLFREFLVAHNLALAHSLAEDKELQVETFSLDVVIEETVRIFLLSRPNRPDFLRCGFEMVGDLIVHWGCRSIRVGVVPSRKIAEPLRIL